MLGPHTPTLADARLAAQTEEDRQRVNALLQQIGWTGDEPPPPVTVETLPSLPVRPLLPEEETTASRRHVEGHGHRGRRGRWTGGIGGADDVPGLAGSWDEDMKTDGLRLCIFLAVWCMIMVKAQDDGKSIAATYRPQSASKGAYSIGKLAGSATS